MTDEVGALSADQTQDTERAERPVLVREFAASFTPGDGRSVDVRIVPYGERIKHNDGLGGMPRGVEYTEEFIPGAFDHQLNAAFRVHANVEHEQGVNGKVGHAILLRSERDGLHGTFRMLETPAGETALQLIRAGALDGVSLEARPVTNRKTTDGVIQRVKANLFGVAFTRFAAYAGARVLAVREEADNEFVEEEAVLLDQPDPAMVERNRTLGISLPKRYQAHPAQSDTSVEADTSEDGTRQSQETASTEE